MPEKFTVMIIIVKLMEKIERKDGGVWQDAVCGAV